jgi:predicted metal-dependent peptidase
MQEKTPDKSIEQCKRALAETRAYMRRHAPYISKTLYGLAPYFMKGLGTLGVTEHMSLIIDPEWFITMQVNMRAGCLMHECMHIIRNMDRMKALPDQEIANIAFDLPINTDLRRVVHKEKKPTGEEIEILTWDLPSWSCYPEKFGFPEGHTGEQYYYMLQKQIKAKQESNEKGSGKGSGGKDSDHKGKGVGGGKCGSCAGNPIDVAIEKVADETVGRAKIDVQRIQRATAKDIQSALRAPGGRGTVPSSLHDVLEFTGQEKPLVPWRQVMSHIIRKTTGRIVAGRSDYSLSRPSKRSYCRRILRPGLVDRKVVVMFIEDSSGSMGKEQLKQVRIEASGIMKQLGIEEAWFMDADAAVSISPSRVRMRDMKLLPVHGRGGTNFIPAIETAQKFKPRPDIVVYLTDGDGTAPPVPPREFEVIWCIVPTPYGRKPANWGHLVVCSDDQTLREPYNVAA